LTRLTTREKLARMIAAELDAMGIQMVPFTGDDLEPVSGHWKSQDCYRWEAIGLTFLHPETGNPMRLSLSSWETMTDIVRSKGVKIERAYRGLPYEFEAHSI
jgi:hypothetical protein